ncbi:MAG: LytTR family transcriptional regulator, partial [Lachnospiraceae bacterium]|nr:LytTR family transcriptional regulator [Lachnospiraceae bacterium]
RVLPEVEHYVTISVNRQKYTLKRSDITSITTQGHYLIITNVDDEEFQSRNTLVQFMDELEQDERFLAINKGVVINMDYIDRIEDGVCILTDGQQFPVKIRELSQISQKIQDYRSHK